VIRDPSRALERARRAALRGLHAALKAIGAIDDRTRLTLRRPDSPPQGHPLPVPELPWVELATGSLGQGLSLGLGVSLAMQLDALPGRVWVLLGGSEAAEGQNWEAMEVAGFYGTRRLRAILDMNRLGQRGPTMLQWRGDRYAERARAWGWNAVLIDPRGARRARL
jgi:transketolase